MRSMTLIGILLIILGAIALIYKGINYTTREKVIDIGPIEATATKHKTFPLSPLFGLLGVAGGISLIILSNKNKSV